MESTIARAQNASGKRATLYGHKGVEPNLLTSKNLADRTMIASTIRIAQENIIARTQVAATVKPNHNGKVSMELNTMNGKSLTEELNQFAAEVTVVRNQIMEDFKNELTKILSGAGSEQTDGKGEYNIIAQAEGTKGVKFSCKEMMTEQQGPSPRASAIGINELNQTTFSQNEENSG